jgi:hypothetical protein
LSVLASGAKSFARELLGLARGEDRNLADSELLDFVDEALGLPGIEPEHSKEKASHRRRCRNAIVVNDDRKGFTFFEPFPQKESSWRVEPCSRLPERGPAHWAVAERDEVAPTRALAHERQRLPRPWPSNKPAIAQKVGLHLATEGLDVILLIHS